MDIAYFRYFSFKGWLGGIINPPSKSIFLFLVHAMINLSRIKLVVSLQFSKRFWYRTYFDGYPVSNRKSSRYRYLNSFWRTSGSPTRLDSHEIFPGESATVSCYCSWFFTGHRYASKWLFPGGKSRFYRPISTFFFRVFRSYRTRVFFSLLAKQDWNLISTFRSNSPTSLNSTIS